METGKNMDNLIQKLRSVRSRLQNLPFLSLTELDEVLARLQRKDYIVAVFGAFSAGKSSLLNALLGESMLVVSPSPTTASVTELGRGQGGGSAVVVTAKTEAELWRDVSNAFAALHLHPGSLEEGMDRAASLNAKDFPTGLRSHIRFLKAIRDGWSAMRDRLGTTWETTLDELKDFSADERHAAYVARVDVHKEHPWLSRGFVFVDTPGVDSIHRRHTDVAFRYMRHADAVLFVMYYTHAFTQGDRDFLLQLSGVQDVTQSNKLFTVINAVDLAKSQEERTAVRDRVEKELRRLGIRFPRVYEVSSQLGLAARQLAVNPQDEVFVSMAKSRLGWPQSDPLPSPEEILAQSGIQTLEKDLAGYVEQEGQTIATDMVQRLLTQLEKQLERLVIDEESRQRADATRQSVRTVELERVLEQLQNEHVEYSGMESSAVMEGFERALRELIFHASERIRLRYRDLFREAYHPGRFRIGKSQDKLQEAAEELADTLARQVDIETRTLSLRAAALAQSTYESVLMRWSDAFDKASVIGSMPAGVSFSDMVVESVQSGISADVLRPFGRYFSSPRQFFEGGGQREMMDASEADVLQEVKKVLHSFTEDVVTSAARKLQAAIVEVYTQLEASLRENLTDALRPFDEHKLEHLRDVQTYLRSEVLSGGM